jgi:hypothetical protein
VSTPAPAQRGPGRLSIGQVFKHDDPVAHWMFSLTALAEDLEVGVEPSRQAIADGELRALLFWHRHTATRLYEANRLVHPATSNNEIKEFVGDLLEHAPGGANLVAAYRRPSPDAASPIEQMYGDLRHLTVHYSKVGKKELSQTLEKYAYLPAQATIRQTESGTPELMFGWVQGVRSMEIFGDIAREDFLKKLRSDSEVTASLTASWLMVVPVALSLYCRVREIDMSELVDTSGWSPRSS